MHESLNETSSKHIRKSLSYFIGNGGWYGLIAGAVAAEIFVVGFVASRVVTGEMVGSLGGVFVFLFGQLFVAFWSGIVGLFSGAASGVIFFLLQHHLSPKRGILLGTVLAMFLLIPITRLIWPAYDFWSHLGDWLPVFAPFIASGAWSGRKLARSMFDRDLPSM